MPMNSAEFMGIFPAAALQRTPKGARLRGKRDFLRGKAPQKILNEGSVAGKPVGADDLIGPGGLGDRAVALRWKTLIFAVGAAAHGGPCRDG